MSRVSQPEEHHNMSELRRLAARSQELLAEAERLERELSNLRVKAEGVIDDTALFPLPPTGPGGKEL